MLQDKDQIIAVLFPTPGDADDLDPESKPTDALLIHYTRLVIKNVWTEMSAPFAKLAIRHIYSLKGDKIVKIQFHLACRSISCLTHVFYPMISEAKANSELDLLAYVSSLCEPDLCET